MLLKKGSYFSYIARQTQAAPSDQMKHSFSQAAPQFGKPEQGWRLRWYTIIFEADTRAGKCFDIALLLAISLSVLVVIIDSVTLIHQRELLLFGLLEWFFTLLFTAEYLIRVLCVNKPLRYVFSFFGLIDLLSILPTYLALFFPQFYALVDIRLLRLLRIFRVLKIPRYFDESQVLWQALRSSRHKIMVFLATMLILSIILGTIMYVVEGPQYGFTSIPTSMYWAIVTMTTTGYGDIHPHTPLGQMITSLAMLLGYGVIALPTGIVGAELAMSMMGRKPSMRICAECLSEGHDVDAVFCKICGLPLRPYRQDAQHVLVK